MCASQLGMVQPTQWERSLMARYFFLKYDVSTFVNRSICEAEQLGCTCDRYAFTQVQLPFRLILIRCNLTYRSLPKWIDHWVNENSLRSLITPHL
jgi:hypothetical protein